MLFRSRHPTKSQAVLVNQLQEGAASKVVLIGIDALAGNSFEPTSVAFAEALRGSSLFTFVANGRVASDPATQKLLFDYRYLLSDAVNVERFSVDGLKQSLALRAFELAGWVACHQLRRHQPGRTRQLEGSQRQTLFQSVNREPLSVNSV